MQSSSRGWSFLRDHHHYLDSIIFECIDSNALDNNDISSSFPSAKDFDNTENYMDALHTYGNCIAPNRQLHSQNHNPTCFKYSKEGTRQYRFFPRPTVEKPFINELGIVHLRRENEWVNPYNPYISAAIGSNHDLSFLATKAKALSLLYYIIRR